MVALGHVAFDGPVVLDAAAIEAVPVVASEVVTDKPVEGVSSVVTVEWLFAEFVPAAVVAVASAALVVVAAADVDVALPGVAIDKLGAIAVDAGVLSVELVAAVFEVVVDRLEVDAIVFVGDLLAVEVVAAVVELSVVVNGAGVGRPVVDVVVGGGYLVAVVTVVRVDFEFGELAAEAVVVDRCHWQHSVHLLHVRC